MNTLEPMAVMKRWVQETGEVYAPAIATHLGLGIKKDAEAVPVIFGWMDHPREPVPFQAAEISLRAFIDFHCAQGSSETHQKMLDDFPLAIVDAAVASKEARLAANKNIGSRPSQRQRMLVAAAEWSRIRPTDQAISEWEMHRFEELIQSKLRSLNP